MLKTVYQSTVSIFDLQNALKKKRRKKLHLGFKSLLVGYPRAFYFL